MTQLTPFTLLFLATQIGLCLSFAFQPKPGDWLVVNDKICLPESKPPRPGSLDYSCDQCCKIFGYSTNDTSAGKCVCLKDSDTRIRISDELRQYTAVDSYVSYRWGD